jgi:hypothetical protein
MKITKSPGAVAAHGASEIDDLGRHVGSENSHLLGFTQGPISATLLGPDRCTALGIAATVHAPVLMLCGLLIEAGHHPTTPLEAFRGEVLCLRVRSIGDGARLSVEDDWHGRPRLRRRRDPQERCGAAPPVALAGQKVTQPPVPCKSMCGAAP